MYYYRVQKTSCGIWQSCFFQWDAEGYFCKLSATLNFTLSFVLSKELVSSHLQHVNSRLHCIGEKQNTNYLGLIKILYAGSLLPCNFKWSSILQEWYLPGVNDTTSLTFTGPFCLNWFWFIHVSTPCVPINTLYALCLLGTSIPVRTARSFRLKDPWFKHQGVVVVLRTPP